MPSVPLSRVAVQLRPEDNVAVAARHLLPGTEVQANGSTLTLSTPSLSASLTPRIAATVAIRSTWQMVSSQTLAGLIFPGQRARNGTRCPPSQTSRFAPRSGPMLACPYFWRRSYAPSMIWKLGRRMKPSMRNMSVPAKPSRYPRWKIG